MPNCFQLTRRSAPDAGPVKLTEIDEEMCRHFGAKVDPKFWFMDWYDCIGFNVAMGEDIPKQIARCEEELHSGEGTVELRETERCRKMLDVLRWLDANFVSYAWAEIGRRQ